MLEIAIPGGQEYWDEDNNRFVSLEKGVTLRLEHSLLSLSKWEAKWHIPFVDNKNLTFDQTLDYIRCMSVDSKVDQNAFMFLTLKDIQKIKDYIDDPMTATTFSYFGTKKPRGKIGNERITSEILYYWMAASQIPFSCEKWHLNRLITLVRVCSEKNDPKRQKVPPKELAQWRRAENARRLAASKE